MIEPATLNRKQAARKFFTLLSIFYCLLLLIFFIFQNCSNTAKSRLVRLQSMAGFRCECHCTVSTSPWRREKRNAFRDREREFFTVQQSFLSFWISFKIITKIPNQLSPQSHLKCPNRTIYFSFNIPHSSTAHTHPKHLFKFEYTAKFMPMMILHPSVRTNFSQANSFDQIFKTWFSSRINIYSIIHF